MAPPAAVEQAHARRGIATSVSHGEYFGDGWDGMGRANCESSNECKRRKIKCNGQTPCQRCGNLSLECVYAPNCCSSSFKDSE